MLVLCLAICSLVLGACADRSIVEAPNPYEIKAADYDRVFEATHLVLRDYQFTVERSDYRFGTVLTEPRGAATLIEFWRDDNTTFEQMLFASGNDLRRIVRVTIEPWSQQMRQPVIENQLAAEMEDQSAAMSPDYGVRVEVQVEQRQLPDQFITNSASSQVQRRLDAVPYELAVRNIPAEYWQPVGRDVLLENRILTEIIRKSATLTDLDDFNFVQP